MATYRTFSLCLLLSLYSLPGSADIYKWVDDKGHVQFGEKAPDNASAEAMDEKLQETGNFLDYPQLPDIPKEKTANPQTQPEALQVDIQLVDYDLPAEILENARNKIQGIYYAYQQWFGWPAKPRRPLTIKIFGSVKSFEDYQRQKGMKVRNRSYYSGNPDREVVMKGTHPESTLKTLYHECSHAILHMQEPATGKWINEGLAEVFSTMELDNNGYPLLNQQAEWTYTLNMMLKKGLLKNAANYLSIPSLQWKSVSSREERSYYMIAWSMMYFLANANDGTLKTLLDINRQMPLDGNNLVTALDQVYPGGIGQFDQDWRNSLNTQ